MNIIIMIIMWGRERWDYSQTTVTRIGNSDGSAQPAVILAGLVVELREVVVIFRCVFDHQLLAAILTDVAEGAAVDLPRFQEILVFLVGGIGSWSSYHDPAR